RTLVPWLLAALATSLLAACGPLAQGDAARVDYAPDATYRVPAGTTVFVALELDLATLGLEPEQAERRVRTWIPGGIRSESANASALVSLRDVETAAGWSAELWQVRLVRERAFEDEDVVTYRFEATVRVDVPAEAYDLTRRVSGTFDAGEGATQDVTFLIEAL
ncbi:MAG: hypothetical protein RI554_01945, partial [Trueperaceae bacterium]|nr:hypothetical protein [Trueperaceae bacterium]